MSKISAIKKDILLYLGGFESATNSQISSFLRKDEGNISKHLKQLKEMGYITVFRKSEGRVTKNHNSLTDRGLEVLRIIGEDDEIKQIVKLLNQEDLEFLWKVHTKLCNMRVKKAFTDKLQKILRRIDYRGIRN